MSGRGAADFYLTKVSLASNKTLRRHTHTHTHTYIYIYIYIYIESYTYTHIIISPFAEGSCPQLEDNTNASVMISLLYLVVLVSVGGHSETGSEEERDIHVMGLVPQTGTVWPAGDTILTASDIALEQVNSRHDILNGYRLRIHWKDTQVCDSYIYKFIVVSLDI